MEGAGARIRPGSGGGPLRHAKVVDPEGRTPFTRGRFALQTFPFAFHGRVTTDAVIAPLTHPPATYNKLFTLRDM